MTWPRLSRGVAAARNKEEVGPQDFAPGGVPLQYCNLYVRRENCISIIIVILSRQASKNVSYNC